MPFFSEAHHFWIDLVNIVLGLATIILVCIIAVSVIRELQARRRKHKAVSHHSLSDTFYISEVGITMLDGGEKIEGTTHSSDESGGDGQGKNNNVHLKKT